ncbi:MAG TPA: aconitase X catalytic domain-containing protein [Bacteroidia bacterium]|nr:aconitase X catalytic domain-containing protein [Bacteroidia bacterium]
MKLTKEEEDILSGKQGKAKAQALDFIIQLGEAFGAERLVDIVYCHYPAEMAIYRGNVEDAVEYAETGAKVSVPTTSSTLCCDLEKPEITDCPAQLVDLQSQIEPAHRKMGILETFTCTPQHLGFIPPFGSYTALVESSAIIYYNSVLGVRTNRGGLLTRHSAVCGKYPLMGYLLDENRKGTHWFKVEISRERLISEDAWSALGFYIGKIAGSGVPVIEGVNTHQQEFLLVLGATLATAGSVTLFHIPGVTPEARTVEEAFQGQLPEHKYIIKDEDLDSVYETLTNISAGDPIDFVTLGCPHYTLPLLQKAAALLDGKKTAPGVRFWICTNRMTRKQAEYSGIVEVIEKSGAKVVCDTCPVESHMRQSTCREFGMKVPNVAAMVCNSGKMLRYVGDLIGCKTALTNMENCIRSAVEGKFVTK